MTVDPFAPSEGGARYKFGMFKLHLVQGVKAESGESISAPFTNPFKNNEEIRINGKKSDPKGGKLCIIEGRLKDSNGGDYQEIRAYLDWDKQYKGVVYPSFKVFNSKPPIGEFLPCKIELVANGRINSTTGKEYTDWKFVEVFKSESAMRQAEKDHFDKVSNGNSNGNGSTAPAVELPDGWNDAKHFATKLAEWKKDIAADKTTVEAVADKFGIDIEFLRKALA